MSGEVPERLKRDELDAGFFLGDIRDFDAGAGLAVEGREQLCQVKELARLTYRVVGPPFLAGVIPGRDWTSLAALPWIGTPYASVHNRLLARLFAELGVRHNVVASVDQEASMVAMVRTGVGLSLCRESIALHEQQANGPVIADRVKVDTALSFVCLNARALDPSIAHAFDVIHRVWG
ncbi:LysR family transcriptional regulator substrate-binding protein [Mesorhizobium sp. M0633]|uniref:LysR family transcriptional regulator substrate-binding protein n=1 Tax=unclassified Mesorhizobium TaxID=325217 RepID=UPI00333D52A4